MKYIKLLMLLAVSLPLFTSCSEDDDVNTVAECTVGFENTDITVSELDGYVKIPIAVSGRRNGPVRLTVEAASTGTNGAVEGENFTITDKTLNLNADTLSTGTINVEVKVIDDNDINTDRQFTLTITSAEGAEIEANTTTVTVKDDDGNFYLNFEGTWEFFALDLFSGSQVKRDITISAVTNENDPDYEKVLTAEATNISGSYGEEITWDFEYNFDPNTLTGTIGFVCGPTVGEFSGLSLCWLINPAGDEYLYEGVVPASWTLTEGGRIPTTLTFDQNYAFYLSAGEAGSLAAFAYITLTKK